MRLTKGLWMPDDRWQELRCGLAELVRDYAGKIAYGNLRLEVYETPAEDDQVVQRVALAYEIPGGSTNQIGVMHEGGTFHMLDHDAESEVVVAEPAEVLARLRSHIVGIPEHRRTRLEGDIDQWLTDGADRQDVLQELNRILRLGLEFRGGTLTVDELTEACRYLVDRKPTSGA